MKMYAFPPGKLTPFVRAVREFTADEAAAVLVAFMVDLALASHMTRAQLLERVGVVFDVHERNGGTIIVAGSMPPGAFNGRGGAAS